MPIFTNRSSSLFISSVATNGTFRLFLKMGRVFPFSSNFALILVHLPRPAENTSGKIPFSSILIFSVVMHSTFWQNVLIGWSQRLNFWNQSDPNKFSVFFSTNTFYFLVIPFSDSGIIISPSNFVLSPVTVRVVLLVLFIIGLFNFLQVCKFIIDKSEPESNWNLTDLFSTLFCLTCPRFLYVWLLFFIFLFLSCGSYIRIYRSFDIYLYDRDIPWPNVIFHSGRKRWVFFFFFCCFLWSLVCLDWNFG